MTEIPVNVADQAAAGAAQLRGQALYETKRGGDREAALIYAVLYLADVIALSQLEVEPKEPR